MGKRRVLLSILLGLAVLAASIGLPSRASADPAIGVLLDGSQLSFPVAPVAESGTILVPLRVIFEALGATVTFDSGVITATKGGKVIQLTLGSATARVGQEIRQLQVPAKAVNGSTLVPLRFVSEAFGAKVNWDQDTRSVIILSAGDTTVPPPTETSATTGQLKIHFIDVGQGDASLIQTPGGRNILVDAGDTFASSAVVSYLQAEGVKSLDVVVISHPHTDHIGGMAQVLSSFTVSAVYDPGYPQTTDTYLNLLSQIEQKDIPYHQAQAGVSIKPEDSVDLEFLAPVKLGSDPNNSSAVFRLTYGDFSALFMGDAEAQEEASLSGTLSAQIIKIGHHGSSTSTTSALLSKVNPQVAIISVGANNSYGHPAEQTLSTLASHGVKVYRTDLNGTVTVTSDGKTYDVTVEKGGGGSGATVVPAPTTTAAGPFVGSKNSDVYHWPWCSSAKQIKPSNQVRFDTAADAQKAGYRPCSQCKPPQ